MSSLHVVVLAAGQGKRMRSSIPKVLHRIGGLPMLERVVLAARALAADAVHVVYGHGGDQVRRHMAHLDLHWAEQARQLGTGHAVAQAMPTVPDEAVVLILYGDVPLIQPATLEPLVAAARAGEVGLLSVRLADPDGYGRILRDPAGAVVGIVEDKDATPEQRFIVEGNTGILAAPAARLRAWLASLDNNNAQGEYYLTDVIAMAVRDRVPVHSHLATTEAEVSGVNDRVQLSVLERHFQRQQAEALMRSGATLADPARVDVRGAVRVGTDVFIDVNVILEGEVEIGDDASIGPNCVLKDCRIAAGAVIHPNCVIEQASVGPNARIGPYARLRPGASLSEDVHIGNFVEVKNTTIGRGSKANHLTYLGDSDIGAGVNVGAGTITCNYDGYNKYRTEIGAGAFIGSNSALVAPVSIGDGALVAAGSVITRDVPADALAVGRGDEQIVREGKAAEINKRNAARKAAK
ncbi:MAG: bifunctional UDP-N-acetylglucosamine diphosphorylase/glucosamine-1-phosphate N-acetyltransferase GlmU [Gammaproteobacteria bacterium]|nr:bifunctional UDP-N-acetylglucosamine diphosphorylase/glucosamine-1-phosphate N-acetyltransferase GlmU [Gammaproteobacteria bacterium]